MSIEVIENTGESSFGEARVADRAIPNRTPSATHLIESGLRNEQSPSGAQLIPIERRRWLDGA
jgi:hypothetical protein